MLRMGASGFAKARGGGFCSTHKLTNQVERSCDLPSVCSDVLLPSSLTFSSGQEQFQGFPCRFSTWFEGHARFMVAGFHFLAFLQKKNLFFFMSKFTSILLSRAKSRASMLVSRLCDRFSCVRASRPEKDSASRLQERQIMS